MRLLITTQKMDERDPILGFMCGWVRAFAGAFDEITVICLEKGEAALPDNVRVFSLGKESGSSRIKYLRNFFRFLFRERSRYDAVFVHMNPEYAILGGLLWRLSGKKIALWYNHGSGGAKLRLAMALSNVVCHTSPYAASAGSKKSRRMPVGVDTDLFQEKESMDRHTAPHRLLSLGRIAPIKRVECIVEAALALLAESETVELSVVGDALPGDSGYLKMIREKVARSPFAGKIVFRGGVGARDKVAALFQKSEFFLNASPAGLFDKTVFEAMATGAVPIVSSKAFAEILPPACRFREGESADLAAKLQSLLAAAPEHLQALGQSLRARVVAEHSLAALAARLAEVLA